MASLNILDLTDDSLLNIFKYLSLRDHISLRDTCSRFRQVVEARPVAFPEFHRINRVAPVLYYTPAAAILFLLIKNNVRTLSVIQGQEYYEGDFRDIRLFTRDKSKVNLGELPDIDRFSSSIVNHLTLSVPLCLCYLKDFFGLIPDLLELRVSESCLCPRCDQIIFKCFPKLDEFNICGSRVRCRHEFKILLDIYASSFSSKLNRYNPLKSWIVCSASR